MQCHITRLVITLQNMYMPDMWAPALPLPDAKMAPLKLTWDMCSRYQLKPT